MLDIKAKVRLLFFNKDTFKVYVNEEGTYIGINIGVNYSKIEVENKKVENQTFRLSWDPLKATFQVNKKHQMDVIYLEGKA